MPESDYQRIGRAIRYLRDEARDQPSLADVAGHVGLSPHHFQRLFKRWAGVSPKRFLQHLTAEHAKAMLRASATVLDTTLEVGLSSQGRLHDLMVSVEAVTPGQFKYRGRGVELKFGFGESPFGTCFAAVSEAGLVTLGFTDGADRDEAVAELERDWPAAEIVEARRTVAPIIRRIFRGDGDPLRLHLTGTNLQIKVWRALLAIPEGRVTTYGEIARAAGSPRAVRAVGSAVGRNPISWLIPCHRVLRSTGDLGGYRWGLERKQAMLAWESARLAVKSRG